MAMIPCAGGQFTIGGSLDGVRVVTVQPFLMYDAAVSRAQWRSVAQAATGYTLPPGRGDGPNHPVHGVSMLDACAWCNALSEQQGRTPLIRRPGGEVYRGGPVSDLVAEPGADGFRIPLEKEWEWAARQGGVDADDAERASANSLEKWPYTIRPWSDLAQGVVDDTLQWTSGPPATEEVDSDTPDSLGFHHLAGNVWEWTWQRRYTRGRLYGVLRGGSVLEPRARCTPRQRVICNATFRLPFVGVRVVR